MQKNAAPQQPTDVRTFSKAAETHAEQQNMFREIAEAQDQVYAQRNGTKINQTALRVEQGEYIITEKN